VIRPHESAGTSSPPQGAGADGTFSGNRYKLGAFQPAEAGEDLAWMDGFFIRWPERQEVKEPQ
jgi:hypothetical protein